MAIRGSLQEAGLPDVIQMLHLGRRTGCLALADRGRHASLFFEDGWVIHATIVNRPDRLGDLLVKSGMVSPAQLNEAMRMQANTAKLLEASPTDEPRTREVRPRAEGATDDCTH